jgi:NAD(P)-dependent dehydrogenase (short-subunit alcohol dehydrogenase family)
MRLKGKTALITGGGRGIGSGIAVAFAQEGCDVAVNFVKNRESAEKTASAIEGLGRSAFLIQADVSITAEAERLVQEAADSLGGIDILVNNAAVNLYGPWSAIDERSWNLIMNTNLRGAFFCAQFTAKSMIVQNRAGSIINLSSTNGRVAESDVLVYNVSKGGMEMLTKSLALELAPHGIRVNSLAPGFIETDANRSYIADPKFRSHYLSHIPLKRFGSVHDCVGAAVFLASDESAYMTGQSIIIDGGLISDQCPKLE